MPVVAPVGAAFEHGAVGQMKINPAVQRERTREKSSSRQEYLSAALPCAGINRFLNGSGVVVCPIALGAVIKHIEDTRCFSGGTGKRSLKQNQQRQSQGR